MHRDQSKRLEKVSHVMLVSLRVFSTIRTPTHAVAGAQQQSQQASQQVYKGLGVAGDLSSQGDLLRRDADAGKAAVDGSATDTLAAGVAPGAAGGLQRISGGSAGGFATGRAGVASLEEPAKAVSTDGDIIGTTVNADALKAAAESSKKALPGEVLIELGFLHTQTLRNATSGVSVAVTCVGVTLPQALRF
jgi:hypothetical protein